MPSWPTLVKEIEHKGRDVIGAADKTAEAAGEYLKEQAYAAKAAAGEVAGPAEDTFATAASRIGVRAALGETLGTFAAIGTVRDALLAIPMPPVFGLHRVWVGAVDWMFGSYTTYESWIVDGFTAAANTFVPSWHTVLDYLLPQTRTIKEIQTQAQPGSPTFAGVETQIHKLQTLSDYQQREIDYLKSKVGGTAPGVTITQQTIVQVPPSLEAQVQAVQGQVTQLKSELGTTNAKVAANTDLLVQLRTDVATLSKELHAVRSTVASWPDVQAQIEQTLYTLGEIQSVQISQIDHHTQQLTDLAPLLLLMEPGIAGLKVLRQLEDTPCMCPHLPGLPNELGAALAAYEVLTHG